MPYTDYLNETCGTCNNRRCGGEECDGMFEGREVYDDDQACMGWEPIGGF